MRSASPAGCGTGARLLIVGAGFIGLEVASTARQARRGGGVVEAAPAPLAGPLGVEVGTWFARLHRRRGVTVHVGTPIASVRGAKAVRELRLADGTRLAADIVLAAVGAAPGHALARRRRDPRGARRLRGRRRHGTRPLGGGGPRRDGRRAGAGRPAAGAASGRRASGPTSTACASSSSATPPAPTGSSSTAIPTRATSASPTGAAIDQRGVLLAGRPAELPGARRAIERSAA